MLSMLWVMMVMMVVMVQRSLVRSVRCGAEVGAEVTGGRPEGDPKSHATTEVVCYCLLMLMFASNSQQPNANPSVSRSRSMLCHSLISSTPAAVAQHAWQSPRSSSSAAMLTMSSLDPQYLDPAIATPAMNHPSSSSTIFNRNEGHSFADFLSHVEAIDAFALTANEWASFNGAPTAQNIGGVGPTPDEFKYTTGRGHNQHMQLNVQRHANNPSPSSQLEHATRSLMSLTLPVAAEHAGYQHTPTSLTFSSPATPIVPAYPAVATARAWRPYESSSTAQIDPSLIGQGEPSTSLRSTSTSSSAVTKALANGTTSSATTNGGSSSRKRPAPTPLAGTAHPNKRPRSQSQSQPSPPTSGNGNSNSSSKPPLLTPAQKKANHIASEQKRRAKIRRGYDALCEVVPSLKAAIAAEQEAVASGSGGWNSAPGSGTDGKRGRKTRSGKAAEEVPASAKDGSRAGPKSESVVLSQSAYAFSRDLLAMNHGSLIYWLLFALRTETAIEHIENLLARKGELLARLEDVRNRVPAQVRGYEPPDKPIWEREWDGGTGVEEGEEDEAEEGDWEEDDQ